jgi:hypothetical protein
LNITLKNNGKFNINGVYVRVSNKSGEELTPIDISSRLLDGGVISATSIVFSEFIENALTVSEPSNLKLLSFNVSGLGQLYKIEVVPVQLRVIDDKKRSVSCDNAIVSEMLTCTEETVIIDAPIIWGNETNPGLSCLDLKNKGVNSNGVYWIDVDGVGSRTPFRVFCDMSTDGGGWTLVLAGGTFQFGKSNSFWNGAGTTNQEFTYAGRTFNTRDSEKIINTLDFQDLRFVVGGREGIFRSETSSSFFEKKTAVTPWTKVSGTLNNLEWNVNDEDGYSRGEFLLGTRMDFDCGQGAPTCYSDYYWFYLGGNVHSVGSTPYGHKFIWVGSFDECGDPQPDPAWCKEVSYVRYHAMGYNSHRSSYSSSADLLFFR